MYSPNCSDGRGEGDKVICYLYSPNCSDGGGERKGTRLYATHTHLTVVSKVMSSMETVTHGNLECLSANASETDRHCVCVSILVTNATPHRGSPTRETCSYVHPSQ